MLTNTCIALVGAGKGGKALLEDFVKIPGVLVKYVCDINPDSEGVVFAKKTGLSVCSWDDIDKILFDTDLDLILEVTGRSDVFEELNRRKDPSINLVGADTTKIIFYFLESQQKVTNELGVYKERLEERIIERTEQIEAANVELQDKVNEFEELNEKLQEINDSKTKYLLHSTHQLKAPFAAIQSYADILLQGYAGDLPERAYNIVDKIKKRCDFLSMSIKEMLGLANLNSCVEENVKMQQTSLEEIVSQVMESLATVLGHRSIRVKYGNTAKKDQVVCNRDQIVMLVNNILENAINYSKDNTEICIGIGDAVDGRIFLEVADQGVGIPKDNIKKVFDEYFRSNNAVKQYDRGTGLGMAIVKKIADIHRCDIKIESELDKGTAVTILFPRI
ncbi:MAG: HAMP domain-containing sensor histidine kinase [Candidatus Tantalella remota]|nr:HAMP domain-containing sensor histidine kinase [Candidatus Tantalella remota]